MSCGDTGVLVSTLTLEELRYITPQNEWYNISHREGVSTSSTAMSFGDTGMLVCTFTLEVLRYITS